MASEANSSYDQDRYSLSRGFAASTRLNLQHYLWRDALGYNLHPAIPLRDESDVRIADIGTGTGIWLIDLSRQFHSARLEGFDVSNEQYPPKEWLPPNLSLDTLDIFAPIPEKLLGRYDAVHLRLLVAVVRDDDPTPILKNIMRMLKPGGYIQWTELNHAVMSISATDPSLKRTATEQVVDRMRRHLISSWVSRLPQTLRDGGYTDVTCDAYAVPPEMRAFFNHTGIMAYEEVSYTAMRGEEGAAFRNLLLESSEEMKRGVTLVLKPEVVVGRKPLLL